MKKITQRSLLAASLCMIASNGILADTTSPPASAGQQRSQMISDLTALQQDIKSLPQGLASGITAGIAAGFTSLEQYIGQLYKDGITWVTRKDYESIPNVTQIMKTNTAQVTPKGSSTPLSPNAAAVQQAKNETAANLHNSLTQFLFSMYQADPTITNNIKTAQGQPYGDYLQNNSDLTLSVGGTVQAPDTLYVADTLSKSKEAYTKPQNQPWLKEPAKIASNYLDFSNLLAPVAYTGQQRDASELFLKYAAQSDQNLIEGVPFSKLYKNPAALLSLKQNSTYQKYVVAMRSFLAIRSMSLNTLNGLIAERTPMPGLGAAAGLSTPDASPLQVEAYQATNRAESIGWGKGGWYQHVKDASPATVQRETLIVLAEIEKQNYQAHLDSERLLAAVTALSLQSNSASSSVFITQENGKIKELIDGSVKATQKPVASTSSAPPSTTPKMQTSAPPTTTTQPNNTTTTTTTTGAGTGAASSTPGF